MAEKTFPLNKDQLQEIIKNIQPLFIFMTNRLFAKISAICKKLLPGHHASVNSLP